MKITLSRLSNSILGSLADQTISTSKKEQYAVVKNNPLLEVLETEFTGYIAVFGKQTFSGMGTTVEKADIVRDADFCGMKTILLGYIKLPGFELQQEATDLYTIFENRGLDINTFSYANQTTEMDKLITDLDKPENLLKLDHLHLSVHFGKMKIDETEFKRIYSEQIGANSELRKMQSASSTRRNLENALHNYLNTVEAMKNFTGWNALHTELNEVVKSVRNSKQNPPKKDISPIVN